ncbi:class I SAM-dependent methyltransferase [Methylobacterium oryzihabitans]|uniref:Class I SAM-dependent methyltransferase n=1 Tax=Methylobacterium oryzihabitans TaxID=2499852 RepID=A0A3S2W8N7_9HYPH|nr:class I SAM-dependent methyltransferase [Methylobacterium oryzihabitans]RVU16387.1 class I SAM-dependent methyltransferase [Methylobacterium oryzihabitans]
MAGNGALPTAGDMHTEGVARAYDRWAPIYDLVFGKVFARGRSAAIAAAERIGGRILEVGVGTGLSLPHYSARSRLVGVDLSAPMLAKARERVARLALRNVEQLDVMDAEHLAFADASFDVVVAQYVVTAVPNPEAALDEFLRVARPGGEIVITTRIGADAGLRGTIESLLSPLVNRLGWRTEFSWQRYQDWVDRTAGVSVIERRPLPPLGHFSLIRLRKSDAA